LHLCTKLRALDDTTAAKVFTGIEKNGKEFSKIAHGVNLKTSRYRLKQEPQNCRGPLASERFHFILNFFFFFSSLACIQYLLFFAHKGINCIDGRLIKLAWHRVTLFQGPYLALAVGNDVRYHSA
jgi:hypothetical protein